MRQREREREREREQEKECDKQPAREPKEICSAIAAAHRRHLLSPDICDMTHSYVGHDSFISGT